MVELLIGQVIAHVFEVKSDGSYLLRGERFVLEHERNGFRYRYVD